MPTLNDRERDRDYERVHDRSYRDQQQDREISLGTGTILGIFFALALLCAVFFGFGYSMGRKSAQPTLAASLDAVVPGSISASSKPSAGSSTLSLPVSSSMAPAKSTGTSMAPPRDPDAEIVTRVENSPDDTASAPKAHTTRAHDPTFTAPGDSQAVVVRQPVKGTTSIAAPQIASPVAAANGVAMVQVAAVSHQEDADVLLSALKKRGYDVFIRQETQDHLLHVQLGPFVGKKDAEAMRQRLLADGYNAIVK